MPTETPTRYPYSAPDVCNAAGISYRQLDYWCRVGLIHPSGGDAQGSGSRRRFSPHDLAIVKVIGAVAGRLPLNRLDRLVGYLDDLPIQQWTATRLVLDAEGDVWLADEHAPKVGVVIDLSLIFDAPA